MITATIVDVAPYPLSTPRSADSGPTITYSPQTEAVVNIHGLVILVDMSICRRGHGANPARFRCTSEYRTRSGE